MLIFRSKVNKWLITLLGLWILCIGINFILPILDLPLWGVVLSIVMFMALILWFTGCEFDYRGQLSSKKCHRLIFGALIKSKYERDFIIPTTLVTAFTAYVLWRTSWLLLSKIMIVSLASLILWCVWFVIKTLNKIFSLRKQETHITWSQIILLAAFGFWIVVIVCCINLEKGNPADTAIVGVFGAVLGWIFQDTIKSVAAFFYLRANGLLQIDDLITVSTRNIEGFVRTISLTTVTIENWDTTTSAFPTYILHAEHFKNSQRMLEGKTLGRLMKKTFIIDSGWVHPLTENDVQRLRRVLDVENFFIEKEVKCDKLNIEVFRLYIYHWLMNNPNVSQQPRLIVRWLEQTSEGLPLQLFVYLTDTMLDAFEWQQSRIMEHVIKAMGWFDLQLYQSPSGYDASNSNIYLTQQTADYRKKTHENARLK